MENLTDKFEKEVRRRLDKIIGRRLWRRHRYGDVRTFSSYEFRDILRRTFRNISIETIRTAKNVAERKARWGGMSIRIGLPFEEELIRKVMTEYENTIPYQLERWLELATKIADGEIVLIDWKELSYGDEEFIR